jgi:hypothetical protein
MILSVKSHAPLVNAKPSVIAPSRATQQKGAATKKSTKK